MKEALIKEKKDLNKKMEIVLQGVKNFTEILEESNNKQVKDTLELAVIFGRFKESLNSMLETDKSIFKTMKLMRDNIEALQSDVSKLKKIHARKTGIKNSRWYKGTTTLKHKKHHSIILYEVPDYRLYIHKLVL